MRSVVFVMVPPWKIVRPKLETISGQHEVIGKSEWIVEGGSHGFCARNESLEPELAT